VTLRQLIDAWTRPRAAEDRADIVAEARSHVGYVREVNEDRFLSRPDRGFWAVADGMGGHSGGVIAASTAISALEDAVDGDEPLGDMVVEAALHRANQLLVAGSKRAQGMSGATIVTARREGDELVIHWAGDSRAYRVSQGKARVVTNDHSVVQELIDAGALSNAEAKVHPQANVITRALGVSPALELETVRVPFLPGDAVLLCTDGLSRSLTVKDLTDPSHSLAHSADRLLRNALRRDGSDNATLVLIARRS